MRSRLALLLPLLFLAGCGQSSVPVSGRVTLDDKPLPNATVIFQPISQSPNPGPGSQGKTDSDGRFTLKLQTQGEAPGAVVGKHKVSIMAFEGDGKIPSSGSDMKFQKRIVPSSYNSKSTLTFDVPPAGSTSADFALKSDAN